MSLRLTTPISLSIRTAIAAAVLASIALVSTGPQSVSASGAGPGGINIGLDFVWNSQNSPDGYSASFINNDGTTLNNCNSTSTATTKGCHFVFEYSVGSFTQAAVPRSGTFTTWSNPTEYETDVRGTTRPKDGGCAPTGGGQSLPLTLNDCFNANSFGQIFFAGASGELSSFKMSMTCLQPAGQKIELFALIYELNDPATSIKGSTPLGSTKIDLSSCPTATSWQGKTFSASDFAMIPFNFKGVTLTQGTPYGVYFAGSAAPGAAPVGSETAVAESSTEESSGTTEDVLQEKLPEELKLLTAVRLIEKGDKSKTLSSRTPNTCVTADGRVIALAEGECTVQIRTAPKTSVSSQSSSRKVLSTFTTTVKSDGTQAGLAASKAHIIRFKKYSTLPNRIPAALVKAAKSSDGILVLGHTGTISGNSPQNVKLSLARATYVRNHLVNQKVKPSLIHVQGLGARQPVTTKKSEKDQRANRRVEVYILS
jgi:flagellar motor protein MotB